jgi:hypothetical protein
MNAMILQRVWLAWRWLLLAGSDTVQDSPDRETHVDPAPLLLILDQVQQYV